MAKFLMKFEVEPGETRCAKCPFDDCCCSIDLGVLDCHKYDLSTLRAMEVKEEE